MANIDERIVRISIEVDGEMRTYEGLDLYARGSKKANATQNTCDIRITNVTKAAKNFILTETSLFNANRKPKRVIVEAGRVSTGVSRLFFGEVTSATPSQPPDVALDIKAQTGTFSKGQIVAKSGLPMQGLRSLAQEVAGVLGLSLDFQAQDKQIARFAFTGAALRLVDALATAGGVDVFVDDETLIVKTRAAPLAGRVRKLDPTSGLIGTPEVTERGVKVKMLLDANTVIGGAIDLTSPLNPAVNGSYTIFGLDFEVASRALPFYFIADCERSKT